MLHQDEKNGLDTLTDAALCNNLLVTSGTNVLARFPGLATKGEVDNLVAHSKNFFQFISGDQSFGMRFGIRLMQAAVLKKTMGGSEEIGMLQVGLVRMWYDKACPGRTELFQLLNDSMIRFMIHAHAACCHDSYDDS